MSLEKEINKITNYTELIKALEEVEELVNQKLLDNDFCEECGEMLDDEDYTTETGGVPGELVQCSYKCHSCGYEGELK